MISFLLRLLTILAVTNWLPILVLIRLIIAWRRSTCLLLSSSLITYVLERKTNIWIWFTLNDSWTLWSLVVIVLHDIDAPIEEGKKEGRKELRNKRRKKWRKEERKKGRKEMKKERKRWRKEMKEGGKKERKEEMKERNEERKEGRKKWRKEMKEGGKK